MRPPRFERTVGRVALRLAALLAGIADRRRRRAGRRRRAPARPPLSRADAGDRARDVARGGGARRAPLPHRLRRLPHRAGVERARAAPRSTTSRPRFGTIVSSNLTARSRSAASARAATARSRACSATASCPTGATAARCRARGCSATRTSPRCWDSCAPTIRCSPPCEQADAGRGRLSRAGSGRAGAARAPRPPAGDGGFDPAPVPVPPRAASAAYGRYLATAIYGCVGCHTDGVDDVEAKLAAPNLLAGGFEFPDPRGDRVVSTNLTPDATGLAGGRWPSSSARSRRGSAPAGAAIRSPMPILRFADAVETEAIFRYLQSVPPVSRDRARRAPRAAGAGRDRAARGGLRRARLRALPRPGRPLSRRPARPRRPAGRSTRRRGDSPPRTRQPGRRRCRRYAAIVDPTAAPRRWPAGSSRRSLAVFEKSTPFDKARPG